MMRPIFLDTPCIIYLIEDVDPYADILEKIFNKIGKGEVTAITSFITVSESLVKPLREKNHILIKKYQTVLSPTFSGIEILTPTIDDAWESAKIRSIYNFTLTDSFQLVLAKRANCDIFLTNDLRLKKYKEVHVKLISEL